MESHATTKPAIKSKVTLIVTPPVQLLSKTSTCGPSFQDAHCRMGKAFAGVAFIWIPNLSAVQSAAETSDTWDISHDVLAFFHCQQVDFEFRL